CLRCWVHLRIRPVPYTTLFRSWVGREASCPHPRLLPRHLARVRHPDREGGPHVLRDAEERPRGFLGAEGRCLAAVDLQQPGPHRSEEHTSELQSRENLVCRLLL